jgi:hypothetical protein
MSTTLREQLSARRRRALADAANLAAGMSDGEATEHERYRDSSRSSASQLRLEQSLDRLARYAELEERLEHLADESATYVRGGSVSFLRDLDAAANGSVAARDRLSAHLRGEEAQRRYHESRDLGGSLASAVVPNWLFSGPTPTSIISSPFLARFAQSLPKGLKQAEPAFSTPPIAAAQAAHNSAVSSTGATITTTASSDLATYATAQLLSVQVLEQSPGAVLDEILLPALTAAVNGAAERDVFAGSGSSGALLGFANLVGRSTAATTSSTVVATVAGIEQLVRSTQSAAGVGGRALVVMHPRRLSWLRQRQAAEGITVVGESSNYDASLVGGIDVLASPGVPTTASTSEDRIYVFSDPSAFSLRASAVSVGIHPSVESGTATNRVIVRRYVSLLARLPGAVGVLSGAGLTAPA